MALFHFLMVSNVLNMVALSDPCTTASILQSSKYRGEYCSAPASKEICDKRLTPGWYRIEDDEPMITYPVPLHKCATTYPVWLNGTLPMVADGIVNATACEAGVFSECDFSYHIGIKNCSGYYVYNLEDLENCNSAYCFGSRKTCPPLEPCDFFYHEFLSDTTERYFNCSSYSGYHRCDISLTPNWYRLRLTSERIDEKIPTTCPRMNSCGTEYPIWIQGTNPSESAGIVNRKACVHKLNNCCQKHYNVQLKNCSSYMVYKLVNTGNCPERYCFEVEEKCPPSTTVPTSKTTSTGF